MSDRITDHRLAQLEAESSKDEVHLKIGEAAMLIREVRRARAAAATPVEVNFGTGSAGLWESWHAHPAPKGFEFELRQDSSSLPRESDWFKTAEKDLAVAMKALEKWREKDVRGQPLVEFVRARPKA